MPHVPFTVRATKEALRHSPAGFFLAGGAPVAEALAGLKSLEPSDLEDSCLMTTSQIRQAAVRMASPDTLQKWLPPRHLGEKSLAVQVHDIKKIICFILKYFLKREKLSK